MSNYDCESRTFN